MQSNFWGLLFCGLLFWQHSLSGCCSAYDPEVPRLAYKLKRTLVGEVRYWWGFQTETALFFAQIHQESRWNPEAKSIYASGLAQFTPDTAKWISGLYSADLGENNPLDVGWALRACVKYDKFLWDRVDYAESEVDRQSFMLSGYNGGAGWVKRDRLLAEKAGKDSGKWACNVEHYSDRAGWAIKENRDYIVKILQKWRPLYKRNNF